MPIDRRDAMVVELLYDNYGASCYRLAHRVLAEPELACTIVRDVFLAVWSGEAVFDPAAGSVRTWLLGATHRSAVSALRSQRQQSGGIADRGLPSGPATLDTMAQYVLELAYFGGYSETEITTVTRITPRMVRTLTMGAMRGIGTRPSTPAPRRGLRVRALEVIRD